MKSTAQVSPRRRNEANTRYIVHNSLALPSISSRREAKPLKWARGQISFDTQKLILIASPRRTNNHANGHSEEKYPMMCSKYLAASGYLSGRRIAVSMDFIFLFWRAANLSVGQGSRQTTRGVAKLLLQPRFFRYYPVEDVVVVWCSHEHCCC